MLSRSERVKRRAEWRSGALLSGFVATGLMTIILVAAYLVAGFLGSPGRESPILARWLWALANNTVTERAHTAFPIAVALQFVSGLFWALVYAAAAEPRLKGPGWRRGLTFSLFPWVLSLLVFLPAVGGGALGLHLGAGPLPIVGNLVLHLVYGAVLGQMYGPWGERLQTETGEPENLGELPALAHDQRFIAVGIVGGLAVGTVVGGLGSALFGLGSRPLVAAVLGAIAGSAGGAFIGSFAGLSPGRAR